MEKESCLISIDSQSGAATASRTEGGVGSCSGSITNYDGLYARMYSPAPFLLVLSLFTLTPLGFTLAPIGRAPNTSGYGWLWAWRGEVAGVVSVTLARNSISESVSGTLEAGMASRCKMITVEFEEFALQDYRTGEL